MSDNLSTLARTPGQESGIPSYESYRREACRWCKAEFTSVAGAHYSDMWCNKALACTALPYPEWSAQTIRELWEALLPFADHSGDFIETDCGRIYLPLGFILPWKPVRAAKVLVAKHRGDQ